MEPEIIEIKEVKESDKKEIESSLEKDTSSVLSTTLLCLAEGLTGIFASNKEERFLSLGHIVQKMRGGKFLYQLNKEWQKYKEKGRIKDDYEYTEQHQECLQELLDYLDKALPDEITFSLLKKIFLVAATEKVSTRETLLPQHYIRFIRNLSAGAILVLNTTYQVANEGGLTPAQGQVQSARDWCLNIAGKSGLEHLEFVENYEKELINYNLIFDRYHSDRSGVRWGEHYRLTALGYSLCTYIDGYEAE